jgi:hypothetical protein
MTSGSRDSLSGSRREPACCEFRFPAEPGFVSILRRFVSDFCAQRLGCPEAAQRVALTTHELLENAVMYSRNGKSTLRVEVRTEGPRAIVSLRTHNQATAEDIEALEGRLREIHEATDPAAYYQMVMRQSSRLRDRSGLGLARIRAEAGSQMSFERESDDSVTVLATTYVDLAEER